MDDERQHVLPLQGGMFGDGGFGYGYGQRADDDLEQDVWLPDPGPGYGYGSGYGRGFAYSGFGPDYYDYHPSGTRPSRGASGPYAGVGPRAYRRADDRIRDDVNDRLTDDPWLNAEAIEVSVANGVVTLAGTVASRADKRLADDLAGDAPGVIDVDNRLRIEPDRSEPSAGPARSPFGSTVAPNMGG
jgi:hypothetical protein